MNEIRILHIMDKVSVDGSKIHGPARQLAYRIPYYDSERFNVMLCNLRKEDPACGILRESGLEVVSLDKGKFDPFTLFDILRIIRDWKPSVLHLHGYASFNFGRVAGRIKGIPIVIQEHFVDERLPGYQRFIDLLLHNIYDKPLAVSHAVRRFMSQKRYICDEDIEVIGNGVPMDRVKKSTDEDIQTLKKELGIDEGMRVVGTVGRLAEMKGQKYFLRAAHHILSIRNDVRFVVVGDGPLAEGLRKEAETLGISDQVIFTGYRQDAVSFLSLCDVAVVSSVFGEGFCAVGIEVFAVQTPLVITDLPCFEDLYHDRQNVLMVPPRDVNAMASAVMELLENKDEARRLIEGGNKTLESYNMAHIAQQYVRLYEDLAAMSGVRYQPRSNKALCG